MSGIKVSALPRADNLDNNDLVYVVNNNNPRKAELGDLRDYFVENENFVTSVNNILPDNGNVTLTKSNIGLANVPDVNPVYSLNGLNGVLTLSAGNNIELTQDSTSITVAVDENISVPFTSLTGDPLSNTSLSAVLANVGVQSNPRTIDANTGNTDLVIGDTTVQWVNADFGVDTSLILTEFSVPIGAMIEVRQGGIGKITIESGAINVNVITPTGTWNTTEGLGTRIQLVHIGGGTWEFK